MSPLEIYLIMTLDSVNGLFFAGIAITLILTIVYTIYYGIKIDDASIDQEEIYRKKLQRTVAKGITWLSIFIILTTLTPNTKTAIEMTVIPKVLNNKQLQQLPDDILNLVHGFIKKITP